VFPEQTLCTPAWLLQGIIRSESGLLQLVEQRISFTTEARCIFDAPLSNLRDVIFPWYYFGGGMKLAIENIAIAFPSHGRTTRTFPEVAS
jgi:hypothetical protein